MMVTTHLSPTQVHQDGLRFALIGLSAVVAFVAFLQSLKLVAPDVEIENGRGVEQIFMTANLIAAPVLAGAALVFALRGRLIEAIVALAAIVIATWASDLVSANYTGAVLVLLQVVRPMIAVFAIVLASRRVWLPGAAALVASMWLLWAWVTFLSDVLLFATGVLLFGA